MSESKPLLSSILTGKCPRCREGNMFPKNTLYTTKFAEMHKTCPCCGQPFEPEVGFYYGAMYVSFGFNVGIFLVAMFLLHFFVEELTMGMMIGVIAATVIGLLPVIFRLSRVIWIYMFVRYDASYAQHCK